MLPSTSCALDSVPWGTRERIRLGRWGLWLGWSNPAQLSPVDEPRIPVALARGVSKQEERSPLVATSYYTRPELVSLDAVGSLREFWQGPHPFPATVEPATPPPISAILIKKMGDNPAFWERDNSFIDVMAELYERVRTKNKDLL